MWLTVGARVEASVSTSGKVEDGRVVESKIGRDGKCGAIGGGRGCNRLTRQMRVSSFSFDFAHRVAVAERDTAKALIVRSDVTIAGSFQSL